MWKAHLVGPVKEQEGKRDGGKDLEGSIWMSYLLRIAHQMN